ncbi:phosphopantetheine-binding protein [Streptomyces sp. PmtG]
MWSAAFGRPLTGGEDFFRLGGTSLLAIRVVSGLQSRGLGSLAVRDVFETRTAHALAARIAGLPEGGGAPGASAGLPAAPTRIARRRRALDLPVSETPGGAK